MPATSGGAGMRCAIVFLAFAVGGCAGEMQKSQMKASLDPLIGRTIADHVVMKGPPAGQVPLGNGRAVFSWKWNDTVNRPGIVAPVGGMMVYTAPTVVQRECVVALTAKTASPQPTFSDWIIESWRWEGQC